MSWGSLAVWSTRERRGKVYLGLLNSFSRGNVQFQGLSFFRESLEVKSILGLVFFFNLTLLLACLFFCLLVFLTPFIFFSLCLFLLLCPCLFLFFFCESLTVWISFSLPFYFPRVLFLFLLFGPPLFFNHHHRVKLLPWIAWKGGEGWFQIEPNLQSAYQDHGALKAGENVRSNGELLSSGSIWNRWCRREIVNKCQVWPQNQLNQWVGPEDYSTELSNLRLEASVRHTLSSPAAAILMYIIFSNPFFIIEMEFRLYQINHFKWTVKWLFSTFMMLCNHHLC